MKSVFLSTSWWTSQDQVKLLYYVTPAESDLDRPNAKTLKYKTESAPSSASWGVGRGFPILILFCFIRNSFRVNRFFNCSSHDWKWCIRIMWWEDVLWIWTHSISHLNSQMLWSFWSTFHVNIVFITLLKIDHVIRSVVSWITQSFWVFDSQCSTHTGLPTNTLRVPRRSLLLFFSSSNCFQR